MKLKIAVIGHVEHVTIARVPALPAPGEITHLDGATVIPGGGGGIAFFQLARSDADVHLFTALGGDDAAATVRAALDASGASVHAATQRAPHTRDIVLITPDGERTILVLGAPLHPRADDDLRWRILAQCDAAYFTAQDPAVLRLARKARLLVVTARRASALARSGVIADVVVGSHRDPRENMRLSDYPQPPRALVLTDGANGGTIETTTGITTFDAPALTAPVVGAYGAGDTFAGALTYFLARGRPLEDACRRASEHATAVLAGVNPIAHQRPLA